MFVSELAFDRIKEAFEKVAKDDAKKLSTVQGNQVKKYRLLATHHRASGGQGGVTMSYLCPHCDSFPLEDHIWWVSGRKERNNWWCAICGEKYDWKHPDRLLVVQTVESVNQVKVFRAHAVRQGSCGNLINALKVLANQQEVGDGLIQNIVTNLCEGSSRGPTKDKSTIIVCLR